MSITAGELRHPVTLLRHSSTTDKYGRVQHKYEPDPEIVWAKVTDVSGRDFVASAAQQLEDIVTITCRVGYGITKADRLRFDGVDYGIVATNRLGCVGDFEQHRCRDVRSRYWRHDDG